MTNSALAEYMYLDFIREFFIVKGQSYQPRLNNTNKNIVSCIPIQGPSKRRSKNYNGEIKIENVITIIKSRPNHSLIKYVVIKASSVSASKRRIFIVPKTSRVFEDRV